MKSEPKNRNGMKSKAAIKKAFLELMKTKKTEQITVSEIVKNADLNRSTFYAHYYDVPDIVDEIQKGVIEELYHIVNHFDIEQTSSEELVVIDEVAAYLAENKDMFKICINTQDVLPFLEELIDVFTEALLKNPSMKKVSESEDVKKSRITFIAGGIVFSYIKWFRDKIDIELSDLTNIVKEQIQRTLSS